jgi:hypothetical protein
LKKVECSRKTNQSNGNAEIAVLFLKLAKSPINVQFVDIRGVISKSGVKTTNHPYLFLTTISLFSIAHFLLEKVSEVNLMLAFGTIHGSYQETNPTNSILNSPKNAS